MIKVKKHVHKPGDGTITPHMTIEVEANSINEAETLIGLHIEKYKLENEISIKSIKEAGIQEENKDSMKELDRVDQLIKNYSSSTISKSTSE